MSRNSTGTRRKVPAGRRQVSRVVRHYRRKATGTEQLSGVTSAEPGEPSGARSARAVQVAGALHAILSARGFFGGMVAIGLAALGQQTLIEGKDPASALRYYVAAIVLLVVSLYRGPWTLRARPGGADGVPDTPDTGVQDSEGSVPSSPWQRWSEFSARLGWKATAAGLVLTLVCAGASALLLVRDTGDPLGGWLWAAALVLSVFTFAGVRGRAEGAGLLPGANGDFYAEGLPRVPRLLEIGLVIAMLLVAAGLRLYDLEYHPGIFGDEGERGMDALAIAQGGHANLFGYGWWGVPNLYFYLVSFMLRLFGVNMVGDRMLSVVSGLVAVFFVYRTGRLLWGSRAGLLAGAMLAVSPLALQFSRLAGESTPTGALWAVGFYYFFLALRARRWSDWLLAGIAWGFSLYFYAAGKLIIPLFVILCFYCLVRWRAAFFKHYALGFLLAGAALLLVFMPSAIFAVQDNWHGFTGRAEETSIFSPRNQAQAFGMYGIAYDPSLAEKPLVSNLMGQPVSWALLVLNGVRATTEVLYRSGDPTAFYQIGEHGGSMLAPLWAALALLGLAYAAWNAWDARYGLVSLWFWVGLLAAALTTDTPSVQRLVGAWPAVMLFPAVVLDRVFAAAWPLGRSFARRWAVVPLGALLLFFGISSYNEYFVYYRSLCPYCTATLQARYAQDLGDRYRAYQLGIGNDLVSFKYGSTRFAAAGVEGVDLAVPAGALPITDGDDKGAAFIVFPENYSYLPLIRLFYPGGTEAPVSGSDGIVRFTSYKLTKEQLAAFRVVHATYSGQEGSRVVRKEPSLGTETAYQGQAHSWSPPPGITYPVSAEWSGGLVAPSYGLYTFALAGGGDTRLEIDGQVRADRSSGGNTGAAAEIQTELVLAKGLHTVRLSGTLHGPESRITVRWAPGREQPRPVEARYLFDGVTGGLSGEIVPMPGGLPQLQGADPFSGKAPTLRRSDPFFGFQEATIELGSEPFVARWRGKLAVPAQGLYEFETASNGPSLLIIDGKPVVDNGGAGGVSSATGSLSLTGGEHDIEVRYEWESGPARLLLYWKPPGGERELVPTTALIPAARSWTAQEQPEAPGAEIAPPAPQGLAPVAIMGQNAGLSNPRGLAVDREGNVYVGDRGNHRVVVFSPEGKVVRTWGKAPAAGPDGGLAPGDFIDIVDLAASDDGRIYVMDYGAQRLQVFDTRGDVLEVVDNQVLQTCAANGIGAASNSELYLACTSTGVVARLSLPPNGAVSLAESALGGSEGDRIEQPVDAAADRSGQVYAIDLKNRLVRFGQGGEIAARWGVPVGTSEGGSRLALSSDGSRAFISDPDSHRVDVVDFADGSVRYFGAPGGGTGGLQAPSGVAVGPDGRVFVLDRVGNNVQVFTP